ncbi:MAG: hypothetical protein PUA65_04525, partial [Acidaminococcus fermentans]|nr:hypothetical protein [Acidaminococcus fermentans]
MPVRVRPSAPIEKTKEIVVKATISFFGSLSNIGVSSNSSTTHGRERFLLTSVFILISPSKAVKSENGIVQSCENQMLL